MSGTENVIDGYSFEHIRNANENEVLKILADVRHEFDDFCGCNICLEDVFAFALNSLPAKYKQTNTYVFPHHKIPQVDIEVVVIRAIKQIMENPTHS
ncbi:late competence development ComFB family protein [candidate division KSB1 bacterium]